MHTYLEDVLVEVVLELLVGVVDKQLFKAIMLGEVLEPVYIQHTDEAYTHVYI